MTILDLALSVLPFLAAVLVGYVIGAIPFSLLIAKLGSVGDLRKVGSGNVGATNVLRSAGPLCGVIALLLDAAKGVVPVLLHKYGHLSLSEEHMVEAGVAA